MQRFSLIRANRRFADTRHCYPSDRSIIFLFEFLYIAILGQSDLVTTPLDRAPEKTDRRAMAMVSTLFFAWGFLTCLNDILIPHLKNIFDFNYTEVMLVQFAFFSSYFLFSMPSGKIVEWIGYKRSMVAGLFTMATGALMFVPAASIPSFPLFLTALIVLAAGMTILQTSANPYVAILGPPRTASSRLNLTQAFNSLGTTLAPRFGSWLILGAALAPASIEAMRAMSIDQLHSYRVQQAASVKGPYIGLAVALILLAVGVACFKLPVIEYAEAHGHATVVSGNIGGWCWAQWEYSFTSARKFPLAA